MFVAGFIGSPRMNFLKATVAEDGKALLVGDARVDISHLVTKLENGRGHARHQARHLDEKHGVTSRYQPMSPTPGIDLLRAWRAGERRNRGCRTARGPAGFRRDDHAALSVDPRAGVRWRRKPHSLTPHPDLCTVSSQGREGLRFYRRHNSRAAAKFPYRSPTLPNRSPRRSRSPTARWPARAARICRACMSDSKQSCPEGRACNGRDLREE